MLLNKEADRTFSHSPLIIYNIEVCEDDSFCVLLNPQFW